MPIFDMFALYIRTMKKGKITHAIIAGNLILLLFFFHTLITGQSVHSGLKELPPPNQIDTLLKLAERLAPDQPDSAIFLAETAIQIQGENENPLSYKLLADAYYYKNDFTSAAKHYLQSANIEKDIHGFFSDQYGKRLNDVGFCYAILGLYDNAVDYYNKALEIHKKTGNKEEIYSVLNNLGGAYFGLAEYEKSIDHFEQTLKFDEAQGDNNNLSISNNNIGKVYQAWGKYDLSIKYFNKALLYSRKAGNKMTEAIRLSNLGMSYLGKKEYDKALEYLYQALDLDKQTGNHYKTAIRENEISKILAKKGDFDKAIEYSLSALDFFRKANIHESMAIVYIDLGGYYLGIGSYKEAENALIESLNQADIMDSQYLTMQAYKGLSEVYEQWGKYDSALSYFKQYESINQDLFTAEKHKQLANFEIKYQTREKEAENALLKKENLLKQRRMTILMLVIAALLIISILLVFSYRLKSKTIRQQKKLAKLEAEKNEKEQQHLHDKVFAEKQINRLQEEQYNARIENKNELLTRSTLDLIQKNELLVNLKDRILENAKKGECIHHDLISILNQNIDQDQDWKKFSLEFEDIHPGFFDELKERFPGLSELNIRLCAYLRIGLTSSEIAQLLYVSVSAINKNRQRLRKKMGLEAETDLTDFLKSID